MWQNIPELREKVEKGVALFDQQIVAPNWLDRIDTTKLGFWLDSETPVEQVFGDENTGRCMLFNDSDYITNNLSADKVRQLEEHGLWLYQSKYSIHQLAHEWIIYITERREQSESTTDTTANS